MSKKLILKFLDIRELVGKFSMRAAVFKIILSNNIGKSIDGDANLVV